MADTETCTDCLPEASTSAAPAQPVASTSSSAVLDPATFSPPAVQQHELPRIEIEFCDRCRWLHRAVWTQTELFLTFPPTPTSGLKAITLLPRSAPETGGRFRVWLYRNRTIEEEYEQNCPDSWGEAELVWDRKVEGGFPELKVLKQRIKALIAPEQDLGHSDKNAFGGKKDATGEAKKAEEEPAPTVEDYEPRFRC